MVIEESVKEKLDLFLKNKFGCSEEKINMMKEKRFLSSEIGFSAADLFQLFLEIEKEFGILFSEKDILSIQFDSYNELVENICKKKEECK
ncbi:MAG: hypothetical protein K2M60_01335 [Lachnospiraceae bacterium]|nr:hypothetical protein [Lachnospiraceae bacterium]MDE6252626.1 hypothetical protein [Lachnospiraceae bacterium]